MTGGKRRKASKKEKNLPKNPAKSFQKIKAKIF